MAAALSGCYSLPQGSGYSGPPPRPPEIEQYYSQDGSFDSFQAELLEKRREYELVQIKLNTDFGTVVINYFKRPKPSEHLILVFPVLGGKKNLLENYFADYFARHGYDSAIVERTNDFKSPQNFDRLEELFRQNIVRDRVALDFFEKNSMVLLVGILIVVSIGGLIEIAPLF
ncbi:MAG: hypothetical protein DCC75_04500, partial [Proteobacteria bacterium]